jgi:hypothetical protein
VSEILIFRPHITLLKDITPSYLINHLIPMVTELTTSYNIKNNCTMPWSEETASLGSINQFVFITYMDCVLYEL